MNLMEEMNATSEEDVVFINMMYSIYEDVVKPHFVHMSWDFFYGKFQATPCMATDIIGNAIRGQNLTVDTDLKKNIKEIEEGLPSQRHIKGKCASGLCHIREKD